MSHRAPSQNLSSEQNESTPKYLQKRIKQCQRRARARPMAFRRYPLPTARDWALSAPAAAPRGNEQGNIFGMV
jgi:hypothetical protein